MNDKQSLSRVVGCTILLLCLMGLMTNSTAAPPNVQQPGEGRWVIALHGGAGSWSRKMDREERESMEQSLHRALTAGVEVLSAGGTALDAVEAVVVVLEDDPRFNAGKGAIFTRAGTHELDASIMDGESLRSGGVAGVKLPKNPIKAARLVMEQTPHLLLGGESADAFATENGCERVTQDYFYTERRFRALQQEMIRSGQKPLDEPAYPVKVDAQAARDSTVEDAGGTVGCVALDVHGNLAAATSTGGRTGKMAGRIGDSPICGAGNYASNKSCAVSGTGKGEEFIRHSIAARVAWLMEERELTVDQAVRNCLHKVMQPGDGGIIAVDQQGNVFMDATTGAMPRGVADSTGRFETAIWIDR